MKPFEGRRKLRTLLAGLGLWYALGLAHDLLVRQDAWYSLSGGRIDVPYATVRCDGALLNALSTDESTCVGDVRGPLSTCERAVRSGCDWAFPGAYLSQFVPVGVELAATACAHAVEEAGRP